MDSVCRQERPLQSSFDVSFTCRGCLTGNSNQPAATALIKVQTIFPVMQQVPLMSSLQSTDATGRSSSVTRRTASTLNACSNCRRFPFLMNIPSDRIKPYLFGVSIKAGKVEFCTSSDNSDRVVLKSKTQFV